MNGKNFLILCLIIAIFSIASVSASENINQVNITDEISIDISEGTLGVSLDEIDNDTLSVSDEEVLTAGAKDWYVNKTAADGGNGSQSKPYNNFNDALQEAHDGDTIHIAGGTYSGELNVDRFITTSLNIVNWGDKEVIFDGTGSPSSIFNIFTNYINITGLTFKNGKGNVDQGGALTFNKLLINSHINAKFINNSAENGGAIYLYNGVTNSIFEGDFINNSARENGGAIYITSNISSSSNNKIIANFIGNSAIKEGGAIYLTNKSENNFIDKCLFINNTAQSIIYIGETGDVKINNNIFLNNDRNFDINFNGTTLNADNNWFGYNNTNYNADPRINGSTVGCNIRLFLNATANPVTLENLEKSEIKFKLFSYNRYDGKIAEYNHTLLKPVNLTVTSTNGYVDKDIIGFNETVTFTPTKVGTARVTASVEDAQDTIELNVPKVDPELSVKVNSIDFGENATFELSYNNTATGKVNITLYRKESDRTYMYPNLDINETISFFDKNLIPGTYNVTVTYSGDDIFNNDTANTTFTISKTNPLVELIAHDINATDVESPLFTITLKKNCPIETLTWNITPKDSTHKYNNKTYSDENGNIVYDILNFHNPEGEYLLNIASLNKDYYDDFTEKATAHIFRLDPKLSFENQEMNYSKEIKIALNYNNTATGNVNINLTGEKHNYIFSPDINETISLSNVLPDEYEVSVDYNGDFNFKNATAYGVLTVNKLDFDIKLEAFDINVTDINRTMFLVTVPYGYDREIGWNQTQAKYEKSRIDGEGVYYIYVRNGGNPAGEYFDYINCTGSDIYNDVFINVTSHILRLNPGLSVSADSINYTENATFKLSYNNTATGKVTINVKGIKYNKIHYNLDINETFSFFDPYMAPGVYNVTVMYSGDDIFIDDTANTTFTVNKINPLLKLKGHNISVTDINASLFTLTFSSPMNSGLTISITPAGCKFENKSSFDDEGNPVVDMLNLGNPAGEYFLNFTSRNSDYYNDFTANVTAYIFKLNPELFVSADSINYTENATFRLTYNNTATGKVNITVNGTKFNKVYTNLDINETISFFDPLMAPGEYNVTVTYSGDDIFANDTANTIFTVNKINPPVGLMGHDINVTDINASLFTISSSKDLLLDGLSISIIPVDFYYEEKDSVDDEGNLVADFLNLGYPAGEYLLNFTSRNSNYYNDVTWVVISRIFKLDPGLLVSADSINYTENATFKLSYNNTATGKVNITVNGTKFNKVYTNLDINETISFFDKDMIPGVYNVTVTYSGDDIFTMDTANTIFTVNKLDPPVELIGHDINVTDINVSLFTLTILLPGYSNFTVSIIPADCRLENKSSSDDSVLDMLNLGNPAGEYLLNFTSHNSDYYNDVTWTVISHIFKLDPKLSVEDNEIDYGEEVKISLNYNNTATGKVNVTLTGKKTNYNFADIEINETILLPKSILPGEYEVSVVYLGDYNFTNATDDAILVINKLDIDPQITYDNATFNVTVPSNVTGNMTLNIANKTLKVPVVKGTAVFDLSDIPDGAYNATVSYPGDDIYNGFEKIEAVLIETLQKVIAENLTKYYNGPERLNVTVTDSKGYPKAGQTVEISINGQTYNRTTDEKGTVSLDINLNSGKYVAEVTVGSESKKVIVTVLPTVEGRDIEKTFMDDTTYDVSVLDSEGNPLEKGSKITFNINGVLYSAEVDGKGVAHLKVDLPVGKYIVTATNPVTGESVANNITVNKASFDISMKTFDVSVADAGALIANITLPKYAEGHVIVTIANESTTADINNKTVDIVGDYAYLPVYNKNLPAGVYSISAKLVDDNYLPSAAKGTFTVNKVDITPKITQKGNVLTVDVPGDATGNIALTVGNETFTSPIVKGTAVFDLSDIPEGEYNATVKYPGDAKYNGFEKISQVTIKSDEIIIIAPDLTKYYHGPERLNVTVTDSKGYPKAGQTVEISINGLTYYRTTDEKGTVSLNINLNSGKYVAEVTVGSESKKVTVTVLPTVEGKDIEKTFKDNTAYDVKVLDSKGNPLEKGSKVSFNINGVLYNAEVDGKGVAHLKVDLPVGKYIVTATNPVTGESVANNITVNKASFDISMKTFDVSVADAGALIANITLPKYAECHVIVTIGNESTTVDINNKTVDIVGDYAYLPVYNKNLPAGVYSISAKLVDDNYLPSTAKGTFTVNKVDITPKITQNGIVLTVDVPGDATGNIALTVGNETFTSPIVKGTAVFDLSDVSEGVYNATVKYPGDAKYNGFEKISQVTIKSDGIIIIAPDLTKYYHGPERFIVNVTTFKGISIVNQTVQITINGVPYYRTTDENGTASLAINLHSGEFDVLVAVNDTNITAKVTVLPTVNGTDLTKVFRSADQYCATFRYSNGTYLEEGSAVEFNVHGVIYTRHVVGNEGLAKLNINLEQGDYIITAINLVTGEQASNNIKVIPRIIENYDTVLYYKNGTKFSAKIIDEKSQTVGAGIEVKFNINGVFYTRVTDENGIVNLNINLGPGDYIITSEYMGCKVSNNIKVLPVLTSEDISMKYCDGTLYKAKLVDGQGKDFAGQKITTNINGIFYERTTDSNGIITINLDNLPVGEYILTSYYDVNGAAVSSKITISS